MATAPSHQESNAPLLYDSNVLDSHFPLQTGNRPGQWMRSVLALFMVLALAIGLLWGMKRFMPGFNRMGGRHVRIVETTMLAPNRSLHLIEVGRQRLLIGSTREHITLLRAIEDRDFMVDSASDRESI